MHAARADQHFTEPPPRYSEASLVKKLEELGIGRPSTYASILAVLRDRELRAHGAATASCPRTRAGWSPPSSSSSSPATSSTTSPPTSRRSSTWCRPATSTGRRCCVTSGRTSTPPSARSALLRTTQVLDALNDALGPHIFPDKGDGSDPRALPDLRNGAAVAEDRPLRRLHRLLQLPGVPLYPADRSRRSRERRRERRPRAGRRSEDRAERLAEDRPFRPLRRRRASTPSPSAPACRRTGRRPASISTRR